MPKTRGQTIIARIFPIIIACTMSLLVKAHDINFTNISRDQGLSQASVHCILQDKKGFLWFGTEDGLNRYDGYSFKVFKTNDKEAHSIKDDYVYCLQQFESERLWIGTKNAGLISLDLKTSTFKNHLFPVENNQQSIEVRSMLADDKGNLWLGTTMGLYRFDPNQESLNAFNAPGPESPGSQRIWALATDWLNRIWVGTKDGLYLLNPEKETFSRAHFQPQPQQNLHVTSIHISFHKEILVGTRQGLFRSIREEDRFQPVGMDTKVGKGIEVEAIAAGTQNTIWVGTNHGLVRLTDNKGSISFAQRYQHNPSNPNSLSHNEIRSIYEDPDGILWVGSWGGGLSKHDRNHENFGLEKHRPGILGSLAPGYIWSIFTDSRNNLWIGTNGNGLSTRPLDQAEYTHFAHDPKDPGSISGNDIHSIAEDSRGNLWFGSFSGLDQFDPKSGKVIQSFHHDGTQKPNQLSNNNVWKVIIDRTDTVWVGTELGGLNQINPQTGEIRSWRAQTQEPGALAHDWIMTLTEGENDILWVGTFGAGLAKTNLLEPGSFQHFSANENVSNSISHNNVSSILEDNWAEVLWIATYGGGLNRFDLATQTFTSWGLEDGLPDNNLYGILKDAKGHLWISTNEGLATFNPKEERFHTYLVDDGLQDNEFNSGAYHRDRQGKLYFGGLKGFNSFFVDNLKPHNTPPAIYITEFFHKNRPVALQHIDPQSPIALEPDFLNQIDIPYTYKIFALKFTALHYAAPQQHQYAYKMVGLNDDWVPTDASNRMATFTGLPPGTYEFQVKASNKDGVWNNLGTSLKVIVDAPPWFSWWAITIYVIIIIALIVGYLQNQRQKLIKERAINDRLKQVDRMRDDFLANTSHELRTPLNGIIGLTESILHGACGPITPTLQENLEMVTSSGRRLSALVDDILDFSKLKHGNLKLVITPISLRPLVNVVHANCLSLLGTKPVELRNNIPNDLPPVNADENRIQQIFYNLIGNAIRFTKRGSVTTTAVQSGDLIIIKVTDTGVGIPPAKQEQVFNSFMQAHQEDFGGTGLGLALTRRLIELHGSDISLTSEVNKGTTFQFSLPISNRESSRFVAHEAKVSKVRNDISESESIVPQKILFWPGTQKEIFKILVVDDEPINRRVLKNHLSSYNCEVTLAESGEQGLTYLKDHEFDLVLLDIMMPGISGYEFCQRLRQQYPTQDLPVIFLSARQQVSDLTYAFDVGGNDYLTKPVSRAELIARVGVHLRTKTLHSRVKSINQEQEVLLRMVKELNRAVLLETLLEATVLAAKQLIPNADATAVFILNEETQVFEIKASGGYDKNLDLPSFSIEELSSRYLGGSLDLTSGLEQCRIITDITRVGKLDHLPVSKELLIAPLATDDVLHGILVFDKFSDDDPFSDEDMNRLNHLREHLVWAIAKSRLLFQLERKTEQIILAQEQLVMNEKMANLGFLAAGISHEVKNPAGFMLGSVGNLEHELSNFSKFLFALIDEDDAEDIGIALNEQFENLRDHLTIIEEGSRRIVAIVQDLGTFARKDYHSDYADITAAISATVNLAKANYKTQVDIQCDFSEALILKCRISQLNQVFMNLIINACQAIISNQETEGSYELGLVRVKTWTKDNLAIIEVNDDGPGIEQNIATQIFEPFFSTKDKMGTGLGLNISKRIIEEHEGTLEVESQPGQGATFRIKLPLPPD